MQQVGSILEKCNLAIEEILIDRKHNHHMLFTMLFLQLKNNPT